MANLKILALTSFFVSIAWQTFARLYAHLIENYEMYVENDLYLLIEPYLLYLLILIQIILAMLGLFLARKKMSTSNFIQRFKDGLIFSSIAPVLYSILGIILARGTSINWHLASLILYVPIGVIATLILELPILKRLSH